MAPMKRDAPGRDPAVVESMSVSELARRWHTTRKTIRGLLGRQCLGFMQIRGRFRIPRKEVTRYERLHGKNPVA